MRKQEIPFSQVKPGEAFKSLRTKRAFSGVKIQNAPNTFQAHVNLNAVMVTYDHQTDLGSESGTLIYIEPEEIVEVFRFISDQDLVKSLKTFVQNNNGDVHRVADELMVSVPAVNRWLKGTNLPNKFLRTSLIKKMENRF